MATLFGHEKLQVYQKALAFAGKRKILLEGLPRRVAASDHWDRAAESILLNIAHASSSWAPKERIAYLGYANGSALECAACLDIFVAKRLLAVHDINPSKRVLAEIVCMLVRMQESTASRVCEEHALYQTKKGNFFSHEDLDVYRAELQLVAWLESVCPHVACSADLLSKLDKSTTSMVLNTAEGNGRFSTTEQGKFLAIAYKATVQSAALMDLIRVDGCTTASAMMEEGYALLRRIATMLRSLSKAVLYAR